MLFFCKWVGKDAPESYVVDASSAGEAASRVVDLTGEAPPQVVLPFPGALVAFAVSLDESGEVVLAPAEHFVSQLDELEATEAAPFFAASDGSGLQCPAEAEADGGHVVRCELFRGHAETHRSQDGLVWE